MKLTVHVKRWARPQVVPPNGRWTFELHGRGVLIVPTNYNPAYSIDDALEAGRKKAHRLGFDVYDTWYVTE